MKAGTPREAEIATKLAVSSFPWLCGACEPMNDRRIAPVILVPNGRSSKSNLGPVALLEHVLSLLRTPIEPCSNDHRSCLQRLSIVALTSYSRQVQLLKQSLPASLNVVVSTIDGFQGREADVVVFTTVRSNAEGDIGFLEDARRLNVAWTRPKLGLIVVGNQRTLQTNPLWQRAIAACKVVEIAVPEANEGLT